MVTFESPCICRNKSVVLTVVRSLVLGKLV